MKARRSQRLFSHVTRAMALALAAQLILALALMVVLVLHPLQVRIAQDKAALIVLSAQTWLELPPGTRPDFEHELIERHDLELVPVAALERNDLSWGWMPFPSLFGDALEQRLGARPRVGLQKGLSMVHAQFSLHGQNFVTRFASPNMLSGQIMVLAIVLLVSSLLAAYLAMRMARRLIKPLEALAKGAHNWGQEAVTTHEEADNAILEVHELGQQLMQTMRTQRQLEHDRSSLLAGISHDLRTPLARLRLALEMLPDDASSDLRLAMVRDVEAMDRLIGQALQLARGDTLPAEHVDLSELVREMIEDYGRNGVELNFIGPTACVVLCVPQALRRILGNYIDNAWRHGGSKPVDMVLQCVGVHWRFDVMDRGPGMPESRLEAAFEPFAPLSAMSSVRTDSHRMGLAIVRQLAEMHGWLTGLDAREGGGLRAWVSHGWPEAQ